MPFFYLKYSHINLFTPYRSETKKLHGSKLCDNKLSEATSPMGQLPDGNNAAKKGQFVLWLYSRQEMMQLKQLKIEIHTHANTHKVSQITSRPLTPMRVRCLSRVLCPACLLGENIGAKVTGFIQGNQGGLCILNKLTLSLGNQDGIRRQMVDLNTTESKLTD